MSDTKKYKVFICGEAYSLVSDESERNILRAADLVDSMAAEISTKADVSNPKRIISLVALRLASKMLNLEDGENKLLNLIDQELSQ